MTNDGRRINVPPWIMDPDMVAPCMCGHPFDPDIPWIIAEERTTNLKRWWHIQCWNFFMHQNDDEYED